MPAAVPAHHPGCETAQHIGCVCKSCRGAMHQCNILYAACWNGNHARPVLTPSFDAQVRNLFGNRFTSLAISPTASQKVRREPWVLKPGTGKQRTQEEQRILDTTVADCLHFIYSGKCIDPWDIHKLVQDLTLHSSWSTLIKGLSTPATSESSYFWSTMLAATSSAWHTTGTLPTTADIIKEVNKQPKNLQKIAYPRSTPWKSIRELGSTADVATAADAISSALQQAKLRGLLEQKIRIGLWLTGSVTSPDLWHHPAAVHHCLMPLVQELRSIPTASPVKFSLDSSDELVEDLMNLHLRKRWMKKGAW